MCVGGGFLRGLHCFHILISICQRVGLWKWMMTKERRGELKNEHFIKESEDLCSRSHGDLSQSPILGRYTPPLSVSMLASNSSQNYFQKMQATSLEIHTWELCPPPPYWKATWSWLKTDGHRIQMTGFFPSERTVLWFHSHSTLP